MSLDASLSTVEQRSLERLPCHIVIGAGGRSAALGVVTDISLDGLHLATEQPLELGSVVPLVFRLGRDGREIRPTVEVVRTAPSGMGLRFVHVSDGDARRLRRYVAGLTAIVAHRDTTARLHDADSRTSEPIRDPARIAQLLTQSRESEVAYTLIPAERPLRERGRLSEIAPGELVFTTVEPSELVRGERLFALYTVDFVSYSFQADVLGRDGNRVQVEAPELVYYSERRASRRLAAASDSQLLLPMPWNESQRRAWTVLDVSPSGLSVRASPDEAHLLPGTPLPGAVLAVGAHETPLTAAHVQHVTLIEEPTPWLKIGISHGVERNERPLPEHAHGEAPSGVLARLRSMGGAVGSLLSYAVHRALRRLPKLDAGADFAVVRFPNADGKQLVGLLNTSFARTERVRAPLVLVMMGYGARKETLSALAMTIVHNFKRKYRDVAVLRVDGTNNLGESEKDPGCEQEGRHNLHYTISGVVADVRGAVEWAKRNRWVDATDITIVAPSFASIGVRRALAEPDLADVSHWISFMGAADAQDTIMHVSGHVDAYGAYLRGLEVGTVTLIGCMTDGGRFCADLQSSSSATLDDARRDMASIRADVTWIVGKHDAFTNPARVRDIMSVRAPGKREVIEVEAGHVPKSSEEALAHFRLITRRLWRHLYGSDLEARNPPVGWLASVAAKEWERVRRTAVDPRSYWRTYLLGEDGLGFDVLNFSPAYDQFVELHAELAQPESRRVLDVGAGTGNVSLRLAARRPGELVAVDIVPEALARLEQKLGGGTAVQAIVQNIDGSPLTAMRRWLHGDLYELRELLGRMPGVGRLQAQQLESLYGAQLHALLRGAELDLERFSRERRLPAAVVGLIDDLRTFARYARGAVTEAELRRRASTLDVAALLRPGGLPFTAGRFDTIVCSLVLSYLEHPSDTLAEMHRVLAPGGRLVISSMKPDADSSKLFLDLVDHFETAPDAALPGDRPREALLASARTFVSSAANLMRLEEEGAFAFFSAEALVELVVRAGFEEPKVFRSFGDPPQAVIVQCRRP